MNEKREGPSRPLKTDEYWNPADGLIYCAVCKTPRQAVVTVQEKTFVPDALCHCQKARWEAEQAVFAQRCRMFEIERLRANGLQDPALRDYTFANDLGCTPQLAKASAYVERFSEFEASSTGLLLWGDLGTGKTFFAGCVANALIEQGVPVLMTNLARVLNTMTTLHPEDRNQFIDSLNAYRLLVLDDLGIERNTEFALEQVFHLIDSRYRSKRPMIITTNLSLDDLNHPADLAHARIYDRILERCVPVRISGQSIRRANAESQIRQTRPLLCTAEQPERDTGPAEKEERPGEREGSALAEQATNVSAPATFRLAGEGPCDPCTS